MNDGNGKKSDQDRYVVPAVARAFEILQLFSAHRRLITAPEMARELDIPRSTVFRLAQTLEHLGLLERNEGGHAFRLGVGVLRLGFEYIASLDLAEIARPYLEALRDESGMSSHLVIRDGDEVVVIVKAARRSAISGSLNLGTRLPAHATVLGRCILADLTSEELRSVFRGHGAKLKAYSEQTPRTVADLEAVLMEDRTRGYAVSESFYESGIRAISAPVRDGTGKVVAAINVTVPSDCRIDEELVGKVRNAADGISHALNYRRDPRVAVNF